MTTKTNIEVVCSPEGGIVMIRCDGRKHDLIEIQRSGYTDDIQTVVRWCATCGAIVVDGELDGRINAGSVMRMRFPSRLKTKATP